MKDHREMDELEVRAEYQRCNTAIADLLERMEGIASGARERSERDEAGPITRRILIREAAYTEALINTARAVFEEHGITIEEIK